MPRDEKAKARSHGARSGVAYPGRAPIPEVRDRGGQCLP
jgi:hypothetical protein